MIYGGKVLFPPGEPASTMGSKWERLTETLTSSIFDTTSERKEPEYTDFSAFVEEQRSRSAQGETRETITTAIEAYVVEKVNTARVFAALKKGKISVRDTKIYPKGSREFVKEQNKFYTQELKSATEDEERIVLGKKWQNMCEEFVSRAREEEGDE